MQTENKGLVNTRIKIMQQTNGNSDTAVRLRESMYRRYADIAQALYIDPVKDGLIRGNKDTFTVIADQVIYIWAFSQSRTDTSFAKVTKPYPELAKLFESIDTLKAGIDKVTQIIGQNENNISFEEFVRGLSSFKVDSIEPLMDNMEERVEEEDDIEIVDTGGYFDDDEDDSENTEVETDTGDDYYQDDKEKISDITYGNAVESTESEEEDELDPEIEANTARIMNVYKDLFEVGFELQIPYGILIKEGLLRINNNGKTKLRVIASVARLYEIIKDVSHNFLVQSMVEEGRDTSKLRELQMRKGTTYYPEFQLGNLFGILGDTKVDSWQKLSDALRPEIRRNIKQNIEAGQNIASIVDALTTCIVVSEFNPNTVMKLRVNVGNNLIAKNLIEREYENRKSTIMAGTGELYHIQQLMSGVIEITLVFNRAAYNGKPLFAYEAVKDIIRRGRKPSLKEMILGQDTSGKIMTTNLNRQNSCIMLIGAGPRSGKGVLTLNLLGTVLADGNPLVYLDGKPDMAKVLWNVGNKNGIKPAVWDAFYNNGNVVGSGAPKEIALENSDIFGVLMYLKAVQLMMVAASLRATKGIMVGGADKRPFFVFDEALAVQSTMAGAWRGIITKAKDRKDTSDEAEWCRGIVKWAEQLSNSLVSTLNSQLPKSGISTAWLFQAIQPTSWKAFDTQGMSGDFNILKSPIMARTSIKLLGKGTTDSEFGLGHREIKGNRQVAELIASEGGRHFAYTEAQKITDINLIKIFKPYLVLNEAENGTESVEELRNNVSKDVWNVIARDGELNKAAGFEGFANLLGTQAIKNLDLGRKLLEEILQQIGLSGKYNSVEEYLYDASIDSFKSLGTLLNNQDENSDEASDYQYNIQETVGDGYQQPNKNNVKYNEKSEDDVIRSERLAKNALEQDLRETKETSSDTNVYSGISDEELRKAVEDGVIGNQEAEDVIVKRRDNPVYTNTGRDGRTNILGSEKPRGTSRLTNENSIDCRGANTGPMSLFEKITFDTPRGAEKYVNKLWKSILDNIVYKGYSKANITRVSIYGGQMYINGKIVNLNGVIGGHQSIRLRDLVSFRILFKKLFMIKELRIDEEMVKVAVVEIGDNAMEQLFILGKKIEVIYVQSPSGNTISYDRNTVKSQAAKKMMEKNKLENEFDMHCSNKANKKWGGQPVSDSIWGWKIAKSSMSHAGKAFMNKNRPSVGKAIFYSGAGLLVGTLGGVAYGITKGIGAIVNLSRGFKR